MTFAVREEFPYPAMFFCQQWDARMHGVDQAENDHEYSTNPNPDGTVCYGLSGRDGSCMPWDAGAGGKSYLQADGTYADDDTPGFEPADLDDYHKNGAGDALERAHALTAWFATKFGGVDLRCTVTNTNGQVSVREDADESHYQLSSRVCAAPGISTFVVAGTFDPSKSIDEMFDSGFSYYFFSGYNSVTEIKFTLDLETDMSEESGGFAPKQAVDFPELTKKVWHQSFSSSQLTGRIDPNDACESMVAMFDVGERARAPPTLFHPPVSSHIHYYVLVQRLTGRCSLLTWVSTASFMGRDMVTRNKAFSEIFAEIGGAWATSALILTVFFKPIILHVAEGQPSKDKQSAHSKRELCVCVCVCVPLCESQLTRCCSSFAHACHQWRAGERSCPRQASHEAHVEKRSPPAATFPPVPGVFKPMPRLQ